MKIYSKRSRSWIPRVFANKIDFLSNNYDGENKNIEIIIICKKYIPHPNFEDLLDAILISKPSEVQELNKKRSIRLLAAGCVLWQFYSSKLKRSTQQLEQLDSNESQKNETVNAASAQNMEKEQLNVENLKE